MVDRVELDGWLIFTRGSDSVKVYCQYVDWEPIEKYKIKHLDTGINYMIPIAKKWIEITATGIWINSNTKITNYIAYLKSWLTTAAIDTKVQRNSSNNYELLDGTNDVYPMCVKDSLGKIRKVSNGDQEYYMIQKLVLEQAGASS